MKKTAILLIALNFPSFAFSSSFSFSDLIQQFATENNIQMESNLWGENKDQVSYSFSNIPLLTYFQLIQVVKGAPTFSGLQVKPRWGTDPKSCAVLLFVKKSWPPVPAPFLEAQEKLFSQATKIDELNIQDGIMRIKGRAENEKMANQFLSTVRQLPLFDSAALFDVHQALGGGVEFLVKVTPEQKKNACEKGSYFSSGSCKKITDLQMTLEEGLQRIPGVIKSSVKLVLIPKSHLSEYESPVSLSANVSLIAKKDKHPSSLVHNSTLSEEKIKKYMADELKGLDPKNVTVMIRFQIGKHQSYASAASNQSTTSCHLKTKPLNSWAFVNVPNMAAKPLPSVSLPFAS